MTDKTGCKFEARQRTVGRRATTAQARTHAHARASRTRRQFNALSRSLALLRGRVQVGEVGGEGVGRASLCCKADVASVGGFDYWKK